MFYICSHPDPWYVMEKGRDKDGCGRSLQFPCNTLLYLLQQIPPGKELRILTDKSLTIDQEAAVSTDFIYIAKVKLFNLSVSVLASAAMFEAITSDLFQCVISLTNKNGLQSDALILETRIVHQTFTCIDF